MLIGEAIKKVRESKGLTQKQLAEMLYVDPSLVCKWERGYKRVTMENLIVLLDILNITFDEFKQICRAEK